MVRVLVAIAIVSHAAYAERSGEAGPFGSVTRGRDMCRTGAKHHGAPLDLDVKGADLHDVYRLLADVGNVNIVVADTVQGKVTMRLKRVAWDLAACTIA